MPQKILYLVRNVVIDPLLQSRSSHREITVVLLHDSVSLRDVPVSRVYVLDEDAIARDVSPAFQTISYKDLLHVIFEADHIVTV